MASVPPPLQESVGVKTDDEIFRHACKKKLSKLMGEYDGLEQKEEKLLTLLEELRAQENCLMKALHDEVFSNPGSSANNNDTDSGEAAASSPAASKTISTTNDKSPPPPPQQQQESEQPTKKQPLPPQPQPPETSAPVADGIAAPSRSLTKRTKRRRRLDPNHNEAKQHARQREQRVLARKRLEDALFADDDDDDDSNSSSSSS